MRKPPVRYILSRRTRAKLDYIIDLALIVMLTVATITLLVTR